MSDEFLDAVRDCLSATEGSVGVEVTFPRSTVAAIMARLDASAETTAVPGNLETVAIATARQLALSDTPWLRDASDTIQRLLDALRGLRGQYENVTADMPSWKDGTPEDYDAWLRGITPVDRRLKFYQWIGRQAVNELLADLREGVRDDPRPPEHRHYSQDEVYELLANVDDEQHDPYPTVLPKGRHMCDVQWHTHTDGMSYQSSCRCDCL